MITRDAADRLAGASARTHPTDGQKGARISTWASPRGGWNWMLIGILAATLAFDAGVVYLVLRLATAIS